MDVEFNWDVIIAHGPGCHDGATAAWAVWRTLSFDYCELLSKRGGFYYSPPKDDEETEEKVLDAKYVHPNSPEGAMKMQREGFPVVFVFSQAGRSVPDELVKDKRVLILDLDMGEHLVPVVKASKCTTLCDHHDTTMHTLATNSEVLLGECRSKFTMFVDTRKSESGASLAWKLTHGADIPDFVNVVRIGDTWQWDEDPEAKFILDYLYVKRAFRSFHDIENTFMAYRTCVKDWIKQGEILNEYKEGLAKAMAKHCDLAYLQTKDGNVYTVAYAPVSILKSEVGSKMKYYAEKRFKTKIDFSAAWTYYPSDGKVQASIRDPGPGLILGDIARNIDAPGCKGGGHPQASSFTFDGIENFHKVFLKTSPLWYIVQRRIEFLSEQEPIDQQAIDKELAVITGNKEPITEPPSVIDTMSDTSTGLVAVVD